MARHAAHPTLQRAAWRSKIHPVAATPALASSASINQVPIRPMAEDGYSPEDWCRAAAESPAIPPSAETAQRAGISHDSGVTAPSGKRTPQRTSCVISRYGTMLMAPSED